jgi:PIN domain-containing protein
VSAPSEEDEASTGEARDTRAIQGIRAVIDTSTLVSARLRRDLQQAAQLGASTAIWSPWIIAELNRVLVWRWIKNAPPGRAANDLSDANERRCAQAAKVMMEWLIPAFEIVNPRPPYPLAWESLADLWDHPIWAAAKVSGAQYVVSENTHDYPPYQPDGHHAYEGIEYLGGDEFLTLLTGGVE